MSIPTSAMAGNMVRKADQGLVTFGQMIRLAIEASIFIVVDIFRLRFKWE